MSAVARPICLVEVRISYCFASYREKVNVSFTVETPNAHLLGRSRDSTKVETEQEPAGGGWKATAEASVTVTSESGGKESESRAWAPSHLDDGAWYHGSPLPLDVLAEGSTITRSRTVAEAFSHKPTCVGIEESGGVLEVCHNGTQRGYLYVIEEAVAQADVRPHPESSYAAGGLEWLTNRPLRVKLVAELPVAAPPCRPDRPHRRA